MINSTSLPLSSPSTAYQPILSSPMDAIDNKVALQSPKISFLETNNEVHEDTCLQKQASRKEQFWGHTHIYVNNRFNPSNVFAEELVSLLKRKINPHSIKSNLEGTPYLPDSYEAPGLDSSNLDAEDLQKVKAFLELQAKRRIGLSYIDLQKLSILNEDLDEIFGLIDEDFLGDLQDMIKKDAGISSNYEYLELVNEVKAQIQIKEDNQRIIDKNRSSVVTASRLQQKRKRAEEAPPFIDSSFERSKSRKTSTDLSAYCIEDQTKKKNHDLKEFLDDIRDNDDF